MEDKMEKYQENNKKIVGKIFKGIGISMIFTIVCLFIFSVLLTYTDIGENTIMPVIIIVTAISILVGSSIENTKIRKKGILNGGLIGAGYILILYLISSLINTNFYLNLESIIMIIIGIMFGILGGIIGVNFK